MSLLCPPVLLSWPIFLYVYSYFSCCLSSITCLSLLLLRPIFPTSNADSVLAYLSLPLSLLPSCSISLLLYLVYHRFCFGLSSSMPIAASFVAHLSLHLPVSCPYSSMSTSIYVPCHLSLHLPLSSFLFLLLCICVSFCPPFYGSTLLQTATILALCCYNERNGELQSHFLMFAFYAD